MEKKTYYLQYNPEIPHKMIDSVVDPQYSVENTVEATGWIHAKQLFGYPLTTLQETMLDQ